MDVSGNLFVLPDHPRLVPLPWHTRAPLGLRSGTSVHVALVESAPFNGNDSSRPPSEVSMMERPADLLISVLDPNAWNRTMKLTASGHDGPGVLHKLLASIHSANADGKFINVELGESFTVPDRGIKDQLRSHRTTLYVTYQQIENAMEILERCATNCGCLLSPLPPTAAKLKLYLGETTVKAGLLHLDKDWRDEAQQLFIGSQVKNGIDAGDATERAGLFDFDVAHALADLDIRGIRLTFPLKGARRLATLHTDTPDTAIKVTEALESDYSILGGLLSKADASSAALYLVVEPLPGKPPLEDKHLASLKSSGNFRRCSASLPCAYQEVLHENISSAEAVRIFSRRMLTLGNRFEQFLGGFVHDEVKRRGSGEHISNSRCIEVCSDLRLPRQRQALRLMRQIGESAFEEPVLFGEFSKHSAMATQEKLSRMLTADACVFMIWRNTWISPMHPDAHPIRNALLHTMFGSSPSLVLIEGTEDEVERQMFEMRSLLRDAPQLRVLPFEWTDEHVQAAVKISSEPRQPRWRELLLRENCLFGQISDWLFTTFSR